jgi:TfoX/Sxy family transcriptional regulator of competence genes
MAYDEALAQRIREVMAGEQQLSERKMFGGLTFLLDGHMSFGVVGHDLMLRLGADSANQALAQPHVRPMDFTGKPMKGMVYVEPEGLHGDALAHWLTQAAAFTRTLPPKA